MGRTGSAEATIVRQSTWVFFAELFILLCGVSNNFMLAYLLGPEGKGLIYLMQLISGVGLIVVNFGLGPAAVFYWGRENGFSEAEVASGILFPSLLLGLLPLLAIGAFWPLLGPILTGRIGALYLWLALAAIPNLTLMWNTSYLCLAKGQIKRYSLLRASSSVTFLICLIPLFVVKDRDVQPVALLWLFSLLVSGGYAAYLLQRPGGARGAGFRAFLREAFGFCWQSHLGAVTQYLQHRMSVFLVAYFLPLRELGLYSIAVSLAELLWYLPQAVATVLLPHVARSSEDQTIPITPMFCRTILAVTALLSLLLAAASTWAIPWILPAFQPSVRVLWLLLPGTVVASVFKVLSSDFTGRGKPLETFRPAVVALTVCFVGGVLVIPRFGITGAALVTTAGYLLNTVLYLRSYSRMTAVPIFELLLLQRKDFIAVNNALRALRL